MNPIYEKWRDVLLGPLLGVRRDVLLRALPCVLRDVLLRVFNGDMGGPSAEEVPPP